MRKWATYLPLTPSSRLLANPPTFYRGRRTFILAGVDTTSNALSRVLHLLCMNQDVQGKLRAELRDVQEEYGKEIPYGELCALPYLDAVCRETLRL